MTTLTDDIRAAVTAAKASCDTAIAKINALDALPPSGGYAPLVWPTPINCLGGTVPNPIQLVPGDGEPGGVLIEPYYSRRMANTPDGSIPVFGDSHMQGLHENLISPFAVNFGYGGLSFRRLLTMLQAGKFPCAASAGAAGLLCGNNDLNNLTHYGDRSLTDPNGSAQLVIAMYAVHLKPYLTGKWVICHLLPCNESLIAATGNTSIIGHNAQVAYVNSHIEAAMAGCAAQIEFIPVNPEFVDGNGNLKSIYHLADGQHLNKAGSALLAAGMRGGFQRLGVQ